MPSTISTIPSNKKVHGAGIHPRKIKYSDCKDDLRVTYPSIEKMKRLLDYEYEVDLETGLRRTAEWLKSN